jgi:tRNA (guanine37-N1)-methyltransferase
VSLEVDIFTLFPAAFDWLRGTRPVRNVLESGGLSLRVIDLRDFGLGTYRQVDDPPYGGGAGMVIRVDVVCQALERTYEQPLDELRAGRRIAVLTPAGRPFSDGLAAEYADSGRLSLLAGRYEGFDHRVHELLATEELSVGPYVLSGGEIPAMAVVDAVVRKLPGALGKVESHLEESFSPALEGRPEYPHYTRPEEFRGWRVPEVLLSGHHAQVKEWRERQSRERDASDL